VAPEFQGRGYGRALVEWLEARVVEAGLKTIRLGHVTAEEHLHAMYTRMGYRTVEVRLSPKWLVDITYMEKRLDGAGGN
jgi:GNAT superfamily N-acetyltransferase